MKPPRFGYLRATGLGEALDALQAEDAKVLAGGQSLVPMLNFRLLRPALLVDINAVAELDTLEETPAGGLRIGALTRHHKLETSPPVNKRFPILAAAVAHIGHLAIRNRGTIGGSLAHADPAAELPLMGVLLDALLTVRSKNGSRMTRASDHISGALSTTLAPGEIVAMVELPPIAAGTGWGFEECARRTGDFALAAAG
ncbi:MAG: xanthine dehydrogenase family protein subunit M, partial [Gammaproteobacteria bacterium]|nr:xanthine dehydrogenase family protein subunit M [Gammaproteobacteria bacterium]